MTPHEVSTETAIYMVCNVRTSPSAHFSQSMSAAS